jgi:hypothetical protein
MSETRKLAAILVSDVVGYSRLTGADEDRSTSTAIRASSRPTSGCTTACAKPGCRRSEGRYSGKGGRDARQGLRFGGEAYFAPATE